MLTCTPHSAESVNFALPSWLEYGKKARVCRCQPDSVRFDVMGLERRWLQETGQAPKPVCVHVCTLYAVRLILCDRTCRPTSSGRSRAGASPIGTAPTGRGTSPQDVRYRHSRGRALTDCARRSLPVLRLQLVVARGLLPALRGPRPRRPAPADVLPQVQAAACVLPRRAFVCCD